MDRGNALKESILQGINEKGEHKSRVEVMLLDLSSLESVRQFATAWIDRGTPLDVLVCNAGIFNMVDTRSETVDGIESHIGTNYLGHFLLTMLLMPSMRLATKSQGRAARVICVSSRLQLLGHIHRSDPELKIPGAYSPLGAYAQSKLAQICFASELTQRARGQVRAIALHPGEVLTDVVRSLPKIMQRMYMRIMSIFLLTPEQGKGIIEKSMYDLGSVDQPLSLKTCWCAQASFL